MTSLFKMQCTAGQRLHEEMYGARLKIFDLELPCCHSKIEQNAEFIIGGKSPLLLIQSLTFLKEHFSGTLPDKDVNCELLPPNSTDWLALKLGPGGLLSDGLTYQFIAVDRNYAA